MHFLSTKYLALPSNSVEMFPSETKWQTDPAGIFLLPGLVMRIRGSSVCVLLHMYRMWLRKIYGYYAILFFFTIVDASAQVHERPEGRMKCGWVWMILTSSPPAVSSSSSAPILTGPLLFQHCVGSQGSHVLEIIHPRATADGGSRRWNCILRVCGLQDGPWWKTVWL